MNMKRLQSSNLITKIFKKKKESTNQTIIKAIKRKTSNFHSYFQEKAKFLGMRKLHRYHLYAPLLSNAAYQKKITYDQAKSLVLKTFKDFTPTFREFAQRLFLDKHLDYEIRKNKQSGAFCSTISPKITPYVLLNFDGTRRDVSTMSHELGHAIHSICASSNPFF